MTIQTYKDLIVWQKSMALAEEIYKLSKAFPKEELYGLTSQLRRAVVSVPSALTSHVSAGTLRIVGSLSSEREPAFPTVPTTAEVGMAYNGEMWRGIASPKGTPPVIVSRLEKAVQEAVNSSEFKAQGLKMGFVPAFMPASEFGSLIAKDDLMLGRLIERAGLNIK